MEDGRRRAGRWGATALMLLGTGLVLRGPVDELTGQWRQHELAASTDVAVSRYRNAVVAAYGMVATGVEDRVVSFEFGAVPVTSDGRLLRPSATRPTPRAAGTFGGTGGAPRAVPEGAAAPGVHVAQPTNAAPSAENRATVASSPDVAAFAGGIIHIPRVGLSQAVVDGVSRTHLKSGPGHYPGTALPGHVGNVVISGHRTTYTKPFIDLDLLVAGDEVIVDTQEGSFRYLVESSHVVEPDDASLLLASTRSLLTLTTCTPKGTADQRLIVVAALDGDPTG